MFAVRRFRSLSSSPSSFVLARLIHSQNPNSPFSSSSSNGNYNECLSFRERFQWRLPVKQSLLAFPGSVSYRFLSDHASIRNPDEGEGFNVGDESTATELETLSSGFDNVSEVAKVGLSDDGWYVPIVEVVISVLDGYHDLTNLPWWITIASSTLFLRLGLLPVLLLQLNKMKKMAELFPKLPPPLPPPFSGKSYKDHFLRFRKLRKAIGCPSYFWNFASVSLQVPCFLLWMTTIRRMSLNHHPGFDCGGALWFQNLTELPSGILGPVFPILIAGLHYTNVQMSFRTSNVAEGTDGVSLLFKYYKLYLRILTVPILAIGFCVPQGSLVYWITNSSLTAIQTFSVNHPVIREKLGLPDKNAPVKRRVPSSLDTLEIKQLDKQMERKVSVQNLSPDELLSLSIQMLSEGHHDRATPLLRLALEKDPDHVRASVVLGQTMMQKEMLTEAIEYLESAIYKVYAGGQPKKAEEIDLLILASSWAGVSHIKQGRNLEGLEHLQRIAKLKEPEDPKGKSHYFDGLLLLASALINEGHKDEAVEYLRRVVAYDPTKDVYLRQCLEDDGSISRNQRS